MIKQLVAFVAALVIVVSAYGQTNYPADNDTAFDKASGIATITLDSNKIANLTNLGMLWGFIKYYHADVAAGKYNMDAELFRILPKVLAATSQASANRLMEEWVDYFGKPKACPSCRMVIQNDDVKLMPDYGYLFDVKRFPQSLIGKLYYIKDNRYTGYNHYYISSSLFTHNPYFANEKLYKDTFYPDAGIRLLALYRYWNMIQYYFPYRHLIGSDWNQKLTEFIPLFCNSENTSAYISACRHMIASIHDSHGNISGASYDAYISGNRLPPVKTLFIKDTLVIVGYDDTLDVKSKVKIGDVIEKINNQPVSELVHKLLPITSGSNYSRQLYMLSIGKETIVATKEATMHFTIKRAGRAYEIELTTKLCPKPPTVYFPFQPDTTSKGYRMLTSEIGYIYPAKLPKNISDTIRQLMKDSKGIIIDMRCYPIGSSPFAFLSWMKCDTSDFEKSYQMTTGVAGMFEYQHNSSIGKDSTGCYSGRVVVIANQSTISQAEYTTMGLSTIKGAVVIGDTTAGADGNVSVISLPAGLVTCITGIGILYPDGTETQRAGVKIDKYVRPTIEGIRAGRDEQLEAAIGIINAQ